MKKFISVTVWSYLFIYMFPFPFDRVFYRVLDPLVLIVGRSVLGLETLIHDTSRSGDTTYEYVKLLALIFLSLLFAILFLTVFKKRISFETLRDITILYARYYVGLTVISYGIAKICDAQFCLPSIEKLESTFGESSPMGLMWAFIGMSKPYYIFVGIMQILGGTLILFRHTKTLGALLTSVIMLNVFIMNLCYDVPVKLLSGHILLIAVVIMLPEIKTLLAFFLQRTPQQLPSVEPITKKHLKAQLIFKILFIGCVVMFNLHDYMTYAVTEGSYSGKYTMDGVYTPELFIVDKDTLTKTDAETERWKSLLLSRNSSKITGMDDRTEYFDIGIDTLARLISFTPINRKGYELHYVLNNKKLELSGLWKGTNMKAIFSRKTYDDYPLTNRGFHWVNETIYCK